MNKKTDKNTCHDIQDEFLKILALQIVQAISGNIRDSGCFTIMADKCTDILNKEQFTVCIR